MKKFYGFALSLGLAFGLNSAVCAQNGNSQNPAPNAQQENVRGKNRAGKMRAGKHRKMSDLNSLNLTDAQKQQLRNIKQNNQSNANRAEMRELMQARRAGTLTADQQTRLESLRRQNEAAAENMRQQILAVLTAEQRRQLQEMNRNEMGEIKQIPAGNPRSERRAAKNGGLPANLQNLNLTDAQKEQLRIIRTNNADNATAQEMRELAQAKRSGAITPEQQTRLKNLKRQAKANGGTSKQQILAILTPEQRRQLEENKLHRKERRGQRIQNAPVNK